MSGTQRDGDGLGRDGNVARFFVPAPDAEESGPRVEIVDWSEFLEFSPGLYFRPETREEMKAVLAGLVGSLGDGRRIRVLGSLHSCSDICVSDAVVDVSRLERELSVEGDRVTVSANWTLHDFNLALSRHGKSITATGGADAQTLAGVVSTNTAPATPRHTIYEILEWAEYLTVDDDGRTVVERRVERGEPGFRAAICSLGAIGVLTRFGFRVGEERFFRTVQKVIPVDDVLEDLDATSARHDFWRIDWLPDSSRGLLWAANRIPAEEADPDGDYEKSAAENILRGVSMFWDRLSGNSVGPLLDGSLRVVYGLLSAFYNLGAPEPSGPLRNMLPVDRRTPLHVAMAEWSFAPADLPRLRRTCREYFDEAGWPNMPIEIELTKTDDAYMSPWNWPGLPYIVKFNFMYLTDLCETAEEKRALVDHLRGLWDRLRDAGIPFKAHWGKLNFMDPAFVRENYMVEEFAPYVRRPFLNEYLADRLPG